MRQIFVDSRDRVSGSTTDFSIQFPETLVVEPGHKMRIDNLRIPLAVPTIQAGKNDTLQVRLGATTYTATMPQGNVDGTVLASNLQGALGVSGAPGSWTVTYDLANISMRIQCSNAFTIVGAGYATQLLSHPYTQTSNSYSFTYVSVLGIDMFYLSSSRFSNLDTIGPQGAHDTLMCAVVTQPFGTVLDTDMPYETWIPIPAMTAQQMDFQLRDRSYNILSIVPNISFLLTID
jgi:hypothetical protein